MLVPAKHGLWLPESYFTLAMNPNPRQTQLLELVQAQGSASIEFLAETFSVTLQTVRRDVQRMAETGQLTRFHGGVRVPSSTTENIGHQQRVSLNADAKTRIARSVAAALPNRACKSITGTTAPRRFMTPRTKVGIRGTVVSCPC